MRMRIAVAVVALVVSVSASAGQLPLPAALLEAESIVVEGVGFRRGLLERAASEFRNQGRFELAASREAADLIAIFSPGPPAGTVVAPFFGGFIADEVKSFSLTVMSPESEFPVWTDTREVHWMERGAVLDLVKDLHRAIERD